MTVTKAYYLKSNELKILLALKGMKELYGFKFGDDKELDRVQIHQALFEMHKRELVYTDGEKLRLIPDIDEIVKNICKASRVLILSESEGRYPEQCVYIADKAVCVQIIGENKENIRLENIEKEYLPEWLTDAGGKLELLIGDESLFREDAVIKSELQILSNKFFAEERNIVFQNEKIKVCFDLISVLTHKRMERIVLMNGDVQDFILISNGVQSSVYEYSNKKLQQELVRCIEGENK